VGLGLLAEVIMRSQSILYRPYTIVSIVRAKSPAEAGADVPAFTESNEG
jgi:hypothetical protein